MKKKILALVLTLVLSVSAVCVPVQAKEFSDIYDSGTATNVETLRLMGVLDGYDDGLFHPADTLSRAQFCKMVTYAMAAQGELGLYRTVTVFPDVKPSHWASSYVNLAAKGKALIAGYPDGAFHPDDTVTVGQAVTILLRLLGYKDTDVGGVWPASYVAVGEKIGLLTGVSTDGFAPLSRKQAAQLFVNLLAAEKNGGGTLYELGGVTELTSLDGGSGKMKTADGKSYTMTNPVASTTLIGCRGSVVLRGDKALTFLPEGTAADGGNTNAAVVVYANGSAAGFDALAGGSDYRIYKNGVPATAADLRKNDVAVYNPSTNAILVSDTRVAVRYESCTPTPAAPTRIRVLGGTELYTLPTAMESLAKFKPGENMTIFLTADGRVAAAAAPGEASATGAVGLVSADGSIDLLCGGSTIRLAAKVTAEEQFGCAVQVYIDGKGEVRTSVLRNDARGDLDVDKRTLGAKSLAENAVIYRGGKIIGLGAIEESVVDAEFIRYARTNWAGKIDLVVLDVTGEEIYGRVFAEKVEKPLKDAEGNIIGTKTVNHYGVAYGNGTSERTPAFNSGSGINAGDYVVARINFGGTGFSLMEKLTKYDAVPASAWIGKTAVSLGGQTFTVSPAVVIYNADSEEWITLDEAFAYADTVSVFTRGGVVRAVEVSYRK